MGKKINYAISLLVGLIVFGFIIWRIGPSSLDIVVKQAKPIYLIPYGIFVILSLCGMAGKLKVILKAHKYNIPFFKTLRYTIAGFGISYLTPAARAGGEPMKAYMLNKECNVPIKVGGSSVVIDKFIEFLGVMIVALIGFFLLFLIPGVNIKVKLMLLGLIIICCAILGFIYYWTIKGKGPFTMLFNLLRIYKFKRFKKFSTIIKDIEQRMEKFFKEHKRQFLIGCLFYLFVIIFGFLEFKFLLLALGINASLMEIILAHIVLGISSFIPVPAGLGFQEAGHSGLFALLKRGGSLGLVFSLIVRIRNLIITGVGFIIIAHFSSKEITKKYNNKKENLKTKESFSIYETPK